MFQDLDKLLNEFLAQGIPSLDCIVYQHGKCVYRKTGGFSDEARTVPTHGKERYYIYSCTKIITCVAALQLWEQGKFDLDDPLYRYLPEFEQMTVRNGETIVPAKNTITVRDLFRMTAGFTYDRSTPNWKQCYTDTNGTCPTREVMRYFAKDPLYYEPGTKWLYSLAHDVIAALVEVWSGMTFGAYVKQYIFDPLGMDRTSINLPDSLMDEVAAQYRFNDATQTYIQVTRRNQGFQVGSDYESGGAGAISTTEDYIKLLEALRIGDIILKKETIDMMATDQLTDQQRQFHGVGAYGYGLGVRCPANGKHDVTDFGWGGAAGAYAAVDRTNGITVFYAQHVLNSPNRTRRGEVLRCAQKALCGAEDSENKKDVRTDY